MSSDFSAANSLGLEFDEDFRELVEMYIEEVPERIIALQDAWDRRDLQVLQRLAHQIKGSATSYGFPEISRLGLSVEAAINNSAPNEEIDTRTQALVAAFEKLLTKNSLG